MSRGTVNKAILVGRVGKDPELRYASTGTAIATFPLATNARQKSEEGSWEDATEWHNIKSFGKSAEFAGEYIKKGSLIFIDGRIQTNSWEDQQGHKHYRTEIIPSSIELLGSKNGQGNNNQDNSLKKTESIAKDASSNDEDDDLPF